MEQIAYWLRRSSASQATGYITEKVYMEQPAYWLRRLTCQLGYWFQCRLGIYGVASVLVATAHVLARLLVLVQIRYIWSSQRTGYDRSRASQATGYITEKVYMEQPAYCLLTAPVLARLLVISQRRYIWSNQRNKKKCATVYTLDA